MEPLLGGNPDERPPPLERPLDNANVNINVLIFTPDERPPLLKGLFSDAKGVALHEGFHCIYKLHFDTNINKLSHNTFINIFYSTYLID